MHCTLNFREDNQPQLFICNECAAVYQLTDESISGQPLFSFRFYYQPGDDDD